MRPGARTPEELETLFGDAFVVRDRDAIAELFEDGALLVLDDARWRAAQLRSPGSQLRSGLTTSPTSPIRSTSCRRATRRSSSHRTAWRFGQLAEIMAAATCALVLLLVLPGGARAATASYSYTGAAQTWTVPAGVFEATFDLYGAQGGTASGVGGLGARVRATLGVTAGEVLRVYVGARGAPGVGTAFNGGAGGGGAGGAGGGGGSDVRRGAGTLADRVLVAGGGGGGAGGGYGFREYPFYEQHCPGGAGGAGGNGGETPGCLPGVSGGSGGPATASAGGTGGSSNYGGGQGTAGQLAVGGAGGADAGITEGGDGGGGGGGLFGGGGGAGGGFFDTPSPGNYRYEDGAGGGGGGGSSFIASPATDTAVTAAASTGAGQVTIAYEVRPGAPTGSAGPSAPTGARPNTPAAGSSIVGDRSAGTVRVAKSGTFALRPRVACAGAGPVCRVKVNVTTTIAARRAAKPKRRTVSLGGASFTVKAGRSTRVRAKLTRTGLRLLRQRRKLKVKVRITVVRGAHTSGSTVAATLRAPR